MSTFHTNAPVSWFSHPILNNHFVITCHISSFTYSIIFLKKYGLERGQFLAIQSFPSDGERFNQHEYLSWIQKTNPNGHFQKLALIKSKTNTKNHRNNCSFLILLGLNHFLSLPKAELDTKNKTKRPLLNSRLVPFFVLKSITHVVKNNCMERGPCRAIRSFLHQMEHFSVDISNRVEHQKEIKRPSRNYRLVSFWCSLRPSTDACTD